MKGDAANLTRALLVRLSITAAIVSLVSAIVFITGNGLGFSTAALTVAVRLTGNAGLAAMFFSIAGLVSVLVSVKGGARFSPGSITAIAISMITGGLALTLSSVVLAITGGLRL